MHRLILAVAAAGSVVLAASGPAAARGLGEAAEVEHAPATLKARHHVGQPLEPVVGEPALVLAAVDEVERRDAIGAEFLEAHAAVPR